MSAQYAPTHRLAILFRNGTCEFRTTTTQDLDDFCDENPDIDQDDVQQILQDHQAGEWFLRKEPGYEGHWSRSHYDWLKDHLDDFWVKATGKTLSDDFCGGIVGAHGDKAYGYKRTWEENDIPFPHGVAIYLLSHTRPYCDEADQYDIAQWVVDNYRENHSFVDQLDRIENPDLDENRRNSG